jgi:hypothetical protein
VRDTLAEYDRKEKAFNMERAEVDGAFRHSAAQGIENVGPANHRHCRHAEKAWWHGQWAGEHHGTRANSPNQHICHHHHQELLSRYHWLCGAFSQERASEGTI